MYICICTYPHMEEFSSNNLWKSNRDAKLSHPNRLGPSCLALAESVTLKCCFGTTKTNKTIQRLQMLQIKRQPS